MMYVFYMYFCRRIYLFGLSRSLALGTRQTTDDSLDLTWHFGLDFGDDANATCRADATARSATVVTLYPGFFLDLINSC